MSCVLCWVERHGPAVDDGAECECHRRVRRWQNWGERLEHAFRRCPVWRGTHGGVNRERKKGDRTTSARGGESLLALPQSGVA